MKSQFVVLGVAWYGMIRIKRFSANININNLLLIRGAFFERNAVREMSRSFDAYVNRKWGGVSKEIVFLIMICVMWGLGYILRIYRVKKMK